MTRILVTGSREWRDWEVIRKALNKIILDNMRNDPSPATIVTGGQVTTNRRTQERYGADYIAEMLAPRVGAKTESHPARWGEFGKAAGPIRNQHLVDLGADVCLAFPLGRSKGTRDCMRRAAAAGIPIINFGDDER